MAWGIWAIAAAVLLIFEMLTVDFTFTMVAGGSLAAAVVSALNGGLVLQVITFAVVSTILLVVVRPWARRHINNTSNTKSNVYALAGKSAKALTRIDENYGEVKIGGDTWSARTENGIIEPGEEVIVDTISGAQAVVVRA